MIMVDTVYIHIMRQNQVLQVYKKQFKLSLSLEHLPEEMTQSCGMSLLKIIRDLIESNQQEINKKFESKEVEDRSQYQEIDAQRRRSQGQSAGRKKVQNANLSTKENLTQQELNKIESKYEQKIKKLEDQNKQLTQRIAQLNKQLSNNADKNRYQNLEQANQQIAQMQKQLQQNKSTLKNNVMQIMIYQEKIKQLEQVKRQSLDGFKHLSTHIRNILIQGEDLQAWWRTSQQSMNNWTEPIYQHFRIANTRVINMMTVIRRIWSVINDAGLQGIQSDQLTTIANIIINLQNLM